MGRKTKLKKQYNLNEFIVTDFFNIFVDSFILENSKFTKIISK